MITSLYAGLLGLIYFYISFATIKARKKKMISLGSGPNNEIAPIVSAHANFSSYIPILLILTFLLERSQILTPLVLHLCASLFSAGRIFHFLAFRGERMIFRWRKAGMHLTLWPLIFLSLVNIGVFLKGSLALH